MIRLYTHKHNGSFDIVADGLENAFRAAGSLAGRVDLGKDEDAPGGTASHAIVVGNPFGVQMVHLRGLHDETWLLHAPNSEGMPKYIVDHLASDVYSVRYGVKKPILTGLFSPSTWGIGVLKRAFPDHPVKLLRHGVLPDFQADLAMRSKVLEGFEKGAFTVLHATSTGSDRKGTKILLKAWATFEKMHANDKDGGKDHQLIVLCNPSVWSLMQDVAAKAGARRVYFGTNHHASMAHWAKGLGLVHAVVQPSRAEGFGLIPLEARACGTPVAATACTGHAEHMPGRTQLGVVVIKSGPSALSDDYPDSRSPTLQEEDVLVGLVDLYENYPAHHAAAVADAPNIAREWSWANVVQEDLEETKWLDPP